MKTVFANRQIAHLWANQSQPFARSGNMRLDGGVLYSYAEPIAHVLRMADGLTIALFRSTRFSVTTAKHLSLARIAWHSHGVAFIVPDVLEGRAHVADYSGSERAAANLTHFRNEYIKERARLMRAQASTFLDPSRATEPSRGALGALALVWNSMRDYAQIFGIPHTLDDLPNLTADSDKIMERAQRLWDAPTWRERAARAAERERARALIDATERAERRRYFRDMYPLEQVGNFLLDDGTQDARVNFSNREGYFVETSHGARVAAAAVATFLADPARHVGARLGDFNVRDVSAQRITVGCHRFNMDTAERIRQQLREKGLMS